MDSNVYTISLSILRRTDWPHHDCVKIMTWPRVTGKIWIWRMIFFSYQRRLKMLIDFFKLLFAFSIISCWTYITCGPPNKIVYLDFNQSQNRWPATEMFWDWIVVTFVNMKTESPQLYLHNMYCIVFAGHVHLIIWELHWSRLSLHYFCSQKRSHVLLLTTGSYTI